MGTHEKTTFQRVSQNSSMEEQNAPFLDNASDEELSAPVYTKESTRSTRWELYLNIALFFSSVVFFAVSMAVKSTGPSDIECATKMNAYSPVMEAVEYEWVTFENEFSTAPTKYRGKPTAELEQAWTDLWKYGAFPVPIEKLGALNESSDVDWRRVHPGEPNSPTAGLLEGFHQIHCLNLIRQYTYKDEWDYTNYSSWGGGPDMVRWHVDHCIETLRMNLMCTADVTPYLIWNDPEGFNGESPSFNTLHKCRKWEPIVDWVKKHVVFNGTAKEMAEDEARKEMMDHGDHDEHSHHEGHGDEHEHGHNPF
ncbi:uncharacterized protein N7469_011386 [Penicillium citrinum]|uniref:Uncharacterized protein n=1 Tax=Penicillium citrinum TaxID=5077 RepID=A0A9W9TCR5_PENCI|nr:uncharacterized protein N7469_011386 [Penicillium citrinum]KAJ5217761.1 hypothetical protein N7469_011386 [Penicillium citrinum]